MVITTQNSLSVTRATVVTSGMPTAPVPTMPGKIDGAASLDERFDCAVTQGWKFAIQRDGGVCCRSGVLLHYRGESYRGWRNERLKQRALSQWALRQVPLSDLVESRRSKGAGSPSTQGPHSSYPFADWQERKR